MDDAQELKAAADKLRELSLCLPEAVELETWERPTYRVRGKIFAMERGDSGRIAVWLKAPPGSQQILIAADKNRFFAPPYVGPKGWIGIHLDNRPDWEEVSFHIRRSYSLIAPKKLAALLESTRKQGGG